MEWTGLNDLREKYLSFFESKGHLRLPSAPLIPQDDSSLLLINAGMTPLKKYFLGVVEPPRRRVTSCQKCVRMLDIERVGKTSRHGSFFEMLGNFSFGDYFKREATAWAWEFLTGVLEIPPEKLWVSIYLDDDEAFDIWTKEVGVAPERIVRLGKEDNFWEHGAGPCGPCSEIYFDRGEKYGCGSPTCGVGCDCDRYVEIWNLVFTQFDSDGNGNYARLKKANIDTGMGLERLACVMQGVDNMFEVDTVQNIIKHVSRIAGVHYHDNEKSDVSLRIISDHIRGSVFMINDGVAPKNDGRGYVLRRLLRRAARHGRLIGIEGPFLSEVCDTVIKENSFAYPDLVTNAEYIKKVIRNEEESFNKTIGQGLVLLNSIVEKTGGKVLSGADAFRLYDTFGFPIDLTEEILAEKGMTIDMDGFKALMDEQRSRARTARSEKNILAWSDDNVLKGVAGTRFVGYDSDTAECRVLAIIRDGELADSISEGDSGVIVTDVTPFYAESGGQVGDSGVIHSGSSFRFSVSDCKKARSGQTIHIGHVDAGMVSVGDTVKAEIDVKRRRAIRRSHTSAHLLQKALRDVLGDHVHQAGSYVDEYRCRFDFSHFSAMTKEELAEVERRVNELILDALDVNVSEMPIEEAKKLGAMALFGEKYGDVVRVVNVSGRSIEFCGGTHVRNTAEIGLFKIISEASVAAGVRRIEAACGDNILKMINEMQGILDSATAQLKLTGAAELPDKIESVFAELKEKDHEIDALNARIAELRIGGLIDGAKSVGSVIVVSDYMDGTRADVARAVCDMVKDRYPNAVCVICAVSEGKGSFVVSCGKEAVAAGANAGRVVREVCALTGGKGGGRPDSAMGGAAELAKAQEALAKAADIVGAMLK